MTNTLNGRQVTTIMYNDAKEFVRRGSKAFLVVGPEQEQGCTNCNGHGYFHLEFASGGPFAEVPPTVSRVVKEHGTERDVHIYATSFGGGDWHQAKIKGYPCPVCKVT